jgi:hypothetical protein
MARSKYSRQQSRKHYDGACFFCGIDDYDLLDAHRIFEGQQGGKYHWLNLLTTCTLCHRKVHTGKIKILGHHPSSLGKWFLHYIDEDGEEKWRPH